MHKKDVPLMLRIDEELARRIKATARNMNMSVSDLIRFIVWDFMKITDFGLNSLLEGKRAGRPSSHSTIKQSLVEQEVSEPEPEPEPEQQPVQNNDKPVGPQPEVVVWEGSVKGMAKKRYVISKENIDRRKEKNWRETPGYTDEDLYDYVLEKINANEELNHIARMNGVNMNIELDEVL